MDYIQLRNQIKSNHISNVYLFIGEEEYLAQYGIKLINEKVIKDDTFDVHIVEGKVAASRINDIIDSFPLFNKSKFIVAKNTDLFALGDNVEIKRLSDKLKDLDDLTFIVFSETMIDKRSSLYKSAKKLGMVLDCEIQKDLELIKWAINYFKSKGFMIEKKTATDFIEMSDKKMNSIRNEMDKLIAYKSGKKVIEESDIELLTTKSITSNIYNLIDALSRRDRVLSIKLLDEMIFQKVADQLILYLISINFIDMLKVVQLKKKKMSNQQISKEIGIRFDWQVRKLYDFSKNFQEKEIQNIIRYCSDADMKYKSGLYSSRLAIEILVLEIIKKSP